ncbi:MAG: OmpA family protein [Bdellovibrionales bacterium]
MKSLIKALLLVAFISACGTSDKKDEGIDVNSNDSTISSQAMEFDTRGSDSGNIAGLSTITFEYDRAALTPSSQALLAQNAEWINKNSGYTVQIEGHCDARGSIEYNLSLGERRARAVKSYLMGLGVDGSRLSIISYGKEKLVDTADSESAHSVNRRANFVPLK